MLNLEKSSFGDSKHLALSYYKPQSYSSIKNEKVKVARAGWRRGVTVAMVIMAPICPKMVQSVND